MLSTSGRNDVTSVAHPGVERCTSEHVTNCDRADEREI
jgi:hypothetical protein